MSTRKIYKIICDGDECTPRGEFTHHGEFIASEARSAARRQGWRSYVEKRDVHIGPVKTIDLCPRCAGRN